ncbi:response regulator transcription factor [Ligilactobacillus cholophilus]|uniref:response regulator transcription factor n=1 Tax=Ligilactobacillus cholophilus TaxID=3050131 RepID=UPI0025B23732|nr:response regulator transcription factor [Ligilactobacillus cholophilus]
MNKVFIIEDDKEIVFQLSHALKKRGFQISYPQDFHNIMLNVMEFNPDIILMDIYLPESDGYYWTNKIRDFSTCPIIFISSAEKRINAVASLSAGADDYIEKPFDIDILIAKIKALLRRTYEFSNSNNELKFKSYTLNLVTSKVTLGNKDIILTTNEFIILKVLFENLNNIVSKEKIMHVLWNNENFIDNNALQVSITRLRKKLRGIKLDTYIKTFRGKGYALCDEKKGI